MHHFCEYTPLWWYPVGSGWFQRWDETLFIEWILLKNTTLVLFVEQTVCSLSVSALLLCTLYRWSPSRAYFQVFPILGIILSLRLHCTGISSSMKISIFFHDDIQYERISKLKDGRWRLNTYRDFWWKCVHFKWCNHQISISETMCYFCLFPHTGLVTIFRTLKTKDLKIIQEHVIQVCYPLSLEIVFDDDTILITAGLWFNLWRGYWAEFWWPQYVSNYSYFGCKCFMWLITYCSHYEQFFPDHCWVIHVE